MFENKPGGGKGRWCDGNQQGTNRKGEHTMKKKKEQINIKKPKKKKGTINKQADGTSGDVTKQLRVPPDAFMGKRHKEKYHWKVETNALKGQRGQRRRFGTPKNWRNGGANFTEMRNYLGKHDRTGV